jgi:hypothetical protein
MSEEQGFPNVPGVPDGWELVHCLRIGEPGEIGLNQLGEPFAIGPNRTIKKIPIIRKVKESKIEQPARYRQFANAEEFKPHRDRWVRHKDDTPDSAFRILEYRDLGVMNISGEPMYFADAFSELLFDDDGTPFGVRIDE